MLLILVGSIVKGFGQDAVLHDVLIHEIFADPTPSYGLPNAEFIEIRNCSLKTINLRNWVLSNGTTFGKIISNSVLFPDSILILVSGASAGNFSQFGSTAIVSPFPSLNNEGDTMVLMNANGQNIHAVAWNKHWYQNDIKEAGGWSLELKDIKKPCLGIENWGASIHHKGGTPGTKNSIEQVVSDTIPPKFIRAVVVDSLTVLLLFSEQLDQVSSANNITISPNVTIANKQLLPPLYNAMQLKLITPLQTNQVYHFTFSNVADCMKNPTGAIMGTFGKSSIPLFQDIVINEVLFDPPSGGYDYVELYNRSNKIINLKDLLLCNRNSIGKISGQVPISILPFALFPGQYVAISENSNWIKLRYVIADSAVLVETSPLPSYPNDKGDVVITDVQGNILDELVYDQQWQFSLLNNREGVALERIYSTNKTQDPNNWHSASSDVGYGTPGYQNTQYQLNTPQINPISLSSSIISPNLDGYEDVLLINYRFPEPNYVINITIFDGNGTPIRYLVKNGLCGNHGGYRWDGLTENGKIPANGNYILLTEIFSVRGYTKRYINNVGLVMNSKK